MVAIKLVLHLLTCHRYGYFRDELYILAWTHREAWGSVDHPPLIPGLVYLLTTLFGDSLPVLRIPAMLAVLAVMLLILEMTRRLGGGRFAQLLVGLAVLVSPAYLVEASILTINPFDMLSWAILQYCLLRRFSGGGPGWWLGAGLALGLGMLTKYSMAFFAVGVTVGVLVTAQRRELRTPWPYAAATMGALLVLPNAIWQANRGWPTLEFLRNVETSKNLPLSLFEFVGMQFAVLHPLVFPIAICGLFALFSGRDRFAAGRPFAWAFAVVAILFFAGHAKMYYLFPAYPVVLAAGGVYCEQSFPRIGRPLRRAYLFLLGLFGALTLPYTVPVLPLETFLRLDERLSIQRHIRFEKGRDRTAPIIYGDMLGWPELAAGVAQACAELPCEPAPVILANNYGLAAALERYGAPLNLPTPVCAHNDYYLWGHGPRAWDVVLAVGVDEDKLRAIFADVTPLRMLALPLSRQGRVALTVCRGLRVSIDQAWAMLKVYR